MDSDTFEIVIQIGGVIALLIIGLVFGSLAERRHYRSIIRREQSYRNSLVLTSKLYPQDRPIESTQLASGSVVIAVDYFKIFLAGWRNFFGGEVRSYASLLDRARREAILRMRESAPDADLFINLRFETADVGGKTNGAPNVELFAYATAIRYRRD